MPMVQNIRQVSVVHGFIKQIQKTPIDDLEIARKRAKEMKK
jgi:hypothetical protein